MKTPAADGQSYSDDDGGGVSICRVTDLRVVDLAMSLSTVRRSETTTLDGRIIMRRRPPHRHAARDAGRGRASVATAEARVLKWKVFRAVYR